jgi:superfamily II DNA or RNA helicase
MGAFAELLNQLDVDGRVKGKQFEHICKWFLTNDPVYKHELRRVWLWDEWPGRWGGDAGIDLVAEDRTGHLWAIQAKAYDPVYRVTKRDVNKFLAESGRQVFTYRMLIATTNLIDRIGERTIQDQEKRVTFFRLNDLQAADVDWPRSPKDLRPPRPRNPARPRKHQREAITKVVKGFTSADRGQLIMACGTGKTLTALFITETLEATRTLVLVPSLSLLKQTLNVWRANCAIEFASLPVCSDDTVANTDDDVAVAHTSDLGVPVTTDPEEIAAFLRQQRSGPRVMFATYQSSPQIAKAFTLGRVPGFDLVVADEAHRCAGPVSSDFATVLDPVEIKAKRRLFMTATPRFFTGRVLKAAQDADYEIASMDDEAKFGTVFHKLSFGDAIERDLFTDYQVTIVGVDDATYLEWAEKGALVTRDGVKVTDARTLAGKIGLAKAMRKYDLHRVISFHSRVIRAREFATSMPDVIEWMPSRQRPKGDLWSRYASGAMPAGDRYALLEHLGRLDVGDRGLLANARCLAEGVDVPTLDGVAFIDPRRSEVDIVQAVGRAIRKADDKTIGTIVIPVFIDTNADPEIALDSSAFKPVWDVIKALRAHDEELGEQLDELRREMGKRGRRPRLPGKIHVDIPVKVNADFAHAFDVRLVQQTTASWEYWLGLLEQFATQSGHTRVPRSHMVDGYDLATWVGNQRAKRARGVLDPLREKRLEEVPGWTWDPYADDWEEGLRQLQSYAASHGHANVGVSYKVDGFRLGAWVNTQRTPRAKGALDAIREQRLQSVPGWTWDAIGGLWEEGFSRLLDYVKRNGNARVAANCCIDGYPLGRWVVKQRGRHAKGVLESDRERRLESLSGWTWDTRAARWEEGFSRLQQYVDLHGDADVPKSYTVNGYDLGAWVGNQRTKRARGVLESDRERQLQAMPGWSWDTRTDFWEENFSRLQQYVKVHGNARVPDSYTAGDFDLGTWVGLQRRGHAKGVLEPDRERRLEDLPDWTWDTRADLWEEGFDQLQQYVQRHGDARVPFKCMVEGYALGHWVAKQRRDHVRGTLDSDREQRLEAVPGWTWEPRTDRWEEGFNRLLNYVDHHGDARVPQTYTVDGYKLGAWVRKQRAKHADGILDADRQRRLQNLPGWTWKAKALA